MCANKTKSPLIYVYRYIHSFVLYIYVHIDIYNVQCFPQNYAEFPWVRYVAPDQEDRPSMLYTLGNESSKRMVWLIIPW